MAELSDQDESANITMVRDLIQQQKPFAILNFSSDKAFNLFIKKAGDELEGLNYFEQVIWGQKPDSEQKAPFPSIFVYGDEDTDSLPKAVFPRTEELMNKYDIDSIVKGFDGKDVVEALHKDRSTTPVGKELVITLTMDEISGSDYYQLESSYYTFVGL